MRRSVRTLRLKHLNRSGEFASGNPRFYYRPKGVKGGVPMPDAPIDHPAFLKAYADAAGVTPRAPVVEGGLASAIALYKGSDAFSALSRGVRASRRPMLDEIAITSGSGPVLGLRQKHILKSLEKHRGHAFNNRLRAWRAFCKWMVSHYRLPADPSDGIKRALVARSDGHIPWEAADVERFRETWPMGSMERLAFELIHWTGARVSDAIRLGPRNVDGEGWLVFAQQKTGGEVAIPFKRALPDFAERYADDLAALREAISARTVRHMTYLHTQRGASRSSKSVSQWFAAKARKAGVVGKTAHGLRKTRAIALAEAGGTSPQIGAWTGHESLKEIERYIRKLNKRRVLSKTEPERKVPTPETEFQKSSKRQGKSNA